MTTQSPVQPNRFRDCADVPELVGRTVGAGSSPRLWLSIGNEVDGDGEPATHDKYGRPCVFDSESASEIVDESMRQLHNLVLGKVMARGGFTITEAIAFTNYILADA